MPGTYDYFVEVAHDDESKYSLWLMFDATDTYFYTSSVDGLRMINPDDLSIVATAPSLPSGYQTLPYVDDYVYTADTTTGIVRKYDCATLTLQGTSAYNPGYSVLGLWGDDTYIYLAFATTIVRLNKNDLSYVDTLSDISCTYGALWGNDTYLFCTGSNGTIYQITLASFTVTNSVSLSPAGGGISICGDDTYLYVCIRNSGNSRVYLSKYWHSLEYIESTTTYLTTAALYTVTASLTGQNAYVILSEDNHLHLYSVDDLSTRLGTATVFGIVYNSSLCSNNVYNSDYCYVGSGYSNGLYKYQIMQLLSMEYPSNSMARVSSIRRVYRPGLYRMELALGDLGFDVEVSEAAIKRVPDEVTEPDTDKEDIDMVMVKIAEHERELRKAKSKVIMEAELERGSALSKSVVSEIPGVVSRMPTIPQLLKEPTPTSILATMSPVAIGKTIYEAGKSLVTNLFKGLFG